MTIEELRDRGLIVLECVSGSRAYGLATPNSDLDIKGVFVLPKSDFYGLNYIPQISNESNDIVYYELGRYMELLAVNNPNILELLNTPEDAIRTRHQYLDGINSKLILSKKCQDTFGKFALAQIKKAKGLNKRIVNPMEKERKSVLEFCYVNYNNGSIPLVEYLEIKKWKQEYCGLVNIQHMKGVFGLYYGQGDGFGGIIKHRDTNEVTLSSIPKGMSQQCLMYFNKDGYSKYCKDYRQYWDWVDLRNEDRYENTMSHGKNYDSKNMMHTFRLLEMAIEIATEQVVNVRRQDREFLLDIKSGKFEYDDLIQLSKKKQVKMEEAFADSTLPLRPNVDLIKKMCFNLREQFYRDPQFC